MVRVIGGTGWGDQWLEESRGQLRQRICLRWLKGEKPESIASAEDCSPHFVQGCLCAFGAELSRQGKTRNDIRQAAGLGPLPVRKRRKRPTAKQRRLRRESRTAQQADDLL